MKKNSTKLKINVGIKPENVKSKRISKRDEIKGELFRDNLLSKLTGKKTLEIIS